MYVCMYVCSYHYRKYIHMSLMCFQQYIDGTIYDSNFTSPYIGLVSCLNAILN